METLQPKILVIAVPSWNSKVGANSWASLLERYDSTNIANIYIRDEIPDSDVCSRYFCISESKIIKSVLKRKTITGIEVQSNSQVNDKTLEEHNERYTKYTKRRRYSMLLAREIIWKLGKWKTKELDEFLDDFKPDIILHSMEGYIHLNRVIEYAIKRTGAKAIGYIWDDNFTYKQNKNFGYKFYRFFQRKSLKKLAKKTDAFFAITEKTKKEADEFFGIDSVILTKPLSSVPTVNYGDIKKPITILYTGNLLIGRDKSLLRLVNAIKKLRFENDFAIEVYTGTHLTDKIKNGIECDFCKIYAPIPQKEVLEKQKEAYILLFLEDIDGKGAKVARLSFSTKTTDYLSSGRCIFAIGNSDVAPIEYIKDTSCGIVACDDEEIENALKLLVENPDCMIEYAKASSKVGIENHSREKIEQRFFNVLNYVYNKKQEP